MKINLHRFLVSRLWGTLILLSFFSYTAEAQLIQIGTGTSTQSTTGISPYGCLYEDGKVQYLIRKSELNALGINTEGNFSSLAFDCVTPPGQSLSGFSIRMSHTTLTTITGFVNTTSQVVYTTTSTMPTTGWNTYNFSSNFMYNNVDNILIQVCFDNSSWTSTGGVRATTTTFTSAHGTYMDGGVGCGTSSLSFSATATTLRPNMRMMFAPKQQAPEATHTYSHPLAILHTIKA